MSEADDEVQLTVIVISKCFVFKIPPLASSRGHRAENWPKEAMWTGRLRVVCKGSKLAILLEHTDRDGIFAVCPIKSNQSVEEVTDSSRYFVLCLRDPSGKKAFIGLGFSSRDDAFDFKVSLQTLQRQEQAKIETDDEKIDFSLKGPIKIGKNLAKQNQNTKSNVSNELSPPPSRKTTKKSQNRKREKKQNLKDSSHTSSMLMKQTEESTPEDTTGLDGWTTF